MFLPLITASGIAGAAEKWVTVYTGVSSPTFFPFERSQSTVGIRNSPPKRINLAAGKHPRPHPEYTCQCS